MVVMKLCANRQIIILVTVTTCDIHLHTSGLNTVATTPGLLSTEIHKCIGHGHVNCLMRRKNRKIIAITLLQKAGVRHKKELAEVKSKHGNEMGGTKREYETIIEEKNDVIRWKEKQMIELEDKIKALSEQLEKLRHYVVNWKNAVRNSIDLLDLCVVAKVMQVICVFITTKRTVPRRSSMVSNIR